MMVIFFFQNMRLIRTRSERRSEEVALVRRRMTAWHGACALALACLVQPPRSTYSPTNPGVTVCVLLGLCCVSRPPLNTAASVSRALISPQRVAISGISVCAPVPLPCVIKYVFKNFYPYNVIPIRELNPIHAPTTKLFVIFIRH